MNITFSDKTLKKCANSDRVAIQTLGKARAESLKRRLDNIREAETLDETRYLPGNFHELTGNRKGQWAVKLNQNYRLIFKPHEDPIPINDDGQFIWVEIKGVTIIEIVDYHQ